MSVAGMMVGPPGSISGGAGHGFADRRLSSAGDSILRLDFSALARLEPLLSPHLWSPHRAPGFSTASGRWHLTTCPACQSEAPNEGYEAHPTLGLLCAHFPHIPGHRF